MTQPDSISAAPVKYRLRWYQYSLRSLLILTLLVAIGLKLTLVWTKHRRMKIAREWVGACLNKKYPDFSKPEITWGDWVQPVLCPADLKPPERLIVLRLAARELESPRQRIAGLKLLVETEPAAALPMLRAAVDGEGDGDVRAWELRLIGLCRDKESVDRVVACLGDKDARVRAAAADALGLIHCPGYQVPQGHGWDNFFVLGSSPPIVLYPLVNTVYFRGRPPGVIPSDRHVPGDAIELPESMRTTLEAMMLQGVTSEGRIAAALRPSGLATRPLSPPRGRVGRLDQLRRAVEAGPIGHRRDPQVRSSHRESGRLAGGPDRHAPDDHQADYSSYRRPAAGGGRASVDRHRTPMVRVPAAG